MFWLWLTTLLFLATLAEIILGLHHLAVPCLLLVAFYFASLLPWQKAFLPILLAAALLDSSLGRAFPSCGAAIILMLVLNTFWKKIGNLDSLLSLLLPGLGLSLILTTIAFVQNKITLGTFRLNSPSQVFAQALFAIILLPGLCQLLDSSARKLSLRRLETISANASQEANAAGENIDYE